MKRIFTALLAALAMVAAGSQVAWAEYAMGGTCAAPCNKGWACTADCGHGCCDDGCCNDGCCGDLCGSGCCGGGWFAEAEALFFKYYRADGAAVGLGTPFAGEFNEDVDFDYEVAPRLTLGYVTSSGLGIRGRYFEYDHRAGAVNDPFSHLSVDTYTIDLELFDRICLNDCWTIELSGGVRYNDFEEVMFDSFPPEPFLFEYRRNAINGFGGVLGLEARRTVGCWSIYGRARGSMIMDNKNVVNSLTFDEPLAFQSRDVNDSTVQTIEYALGVEYNRCCSNGCSVRIRAGWEWQRWVDYSSSFLGPIDPISALTGGAFGLGESIFTGPADVGFSGFTASVAIER